VNRIPTFGCVVLATADILLIVPRATTLQYILSLIAAGALFFRHRWPHATLLATLPGLFADTAILASLIALYSVAVVERRRLILGCAGIVVACGALIPWPNLAFMPAPRIVRAVIYTLLAVAAPMGLGLLVRTRRELASRLNELATHRERERDRHAERVLITERTRLAREMHDVVSHQVSLIALTAGALSVTTTDQSTVETAQTLRSLAVRTLDELRHMVGVLRSAPAGLLPQPRLADLDHLLDNHKNAALYISGLSGRELSEPMERAVYRTVQEALTNIAKHAPQATTAINISADSNFLTVQVTNQASPLSDPAHTLPHGNHGLTGLKERAQLLGGQCDAYALSGGGFTVRMTIPLENI
jgi:signal transduction histidine kinase